MTAPLPTKIPLVIGLTGPIGSGVSTVAEILGANGFHRLRLSDLIKQELAGEERLANVKAVEGLPHLRSKMQDLGDKKRQGSSLSYWIDKAVSSAPPDADLVIDGIRNLGEVERLRNDLYTRFYLVAVVA